MAVSAAELMVRIDADTKGAEAGMERVSQKVSGFGGTLKTALGTGMGMLGSQIVAAAGGSVFNLGKGLLTANANAEQLGQSLQIAVGDRADSVYKSLQKFAAKTPFEFPELVQSTVNLENFGIRADQVIGNTGRTWTGIIGDTASAMGKTYDQVTQAVLDASTGEYERLKELGVKASVEGDKVRFSYMKNGKQMVAEADRNNSEMIQSTLAGIWNDKYQGAMQKQSQTWNGQMSTLRDNWNMTMQRMSGGIFEFAKGGLKQANMFFDRLGVGLDRGMKPWDAAMRALHFSLQDAFGKATGNQIFSVVNGITTGVKTLAGWMQELFESKTMDRFLNSSKKMGSAILSIGKAFQTGGLSAGFKSIFGDQGRKLLEGFGDLFAARFKSVGDALSHFQSGFAPLDRVIQNTSKLFTDAGRIIQEVFQGDWKGALAVGERMLNHFGETGKAAWALIKTGFDAINWGAVWDTLGSAAGAIGSWLLDQFNAIDWGAVWATVQDKGKEIGGYLGDAATEIGTWLGLQVAGIPWATVWSFVSDKGKDLVGFLGSAAVEFGGWVGEQVAAIDWSAVWAFAQDKGKAIAGYLGTAAVEIGSWLGLQIAGIDWAGVWGMVKDKGKQLAGFLGSAATELGTWLGDEVASIDWATVWTNVVGKGKALAGNLGSIASELGTWLMNSISGIDWNAVGAAIGNGLRGIASVVGSAIKDVITSAPGGQWIWDHVIGGGGNVVPSPGGTDYGFNLGVFNGPGVSANPAGGQRTSDLGSASGSTNQSIDQIILAVLRAFPSSIIPIER